MQFLLIPFSWIYASIMAIRNVFFDRHWLKSYSPKVYTIAIGNLNVGGTGKTPFTELLIAAFQSRYNIAIVSRGYKRKSSGFKWVEVDSDSDITGDEALQIKKKFPSVVSAVCEKRSMAIQKIEKERPDINLILLDDAFQHRSVQAHLYVLLSTFSKPFFNDHVLPAGRLRELKSGKSRADFIVITKCPDVLSQFDQNEFALKVAPEKAQDVFFATEKYGRPYDLFSGSTKDFDKEGVVLVSGLADNSRFLKHLSTLFEAVEVFSLPDHANYTVKLIERIKTSYLDLDTQFLSCIVTTEKDAVKLRAYQEQLENIPVYVMPYEHRFFEPDKFLSAIENKIKT